MIFCMASKTNVDQLEYSEVVNELILAGILLPVLTLKLHKYPDSFLTLEIRHP